MTSELIASILNYGTGFLGIIGWFFCLGHLMVDSVFGKREYSLAWIFPASVTGIMFLLISVTPWFPLVFPSLTILGLTLVGLWFLKRPAFPHFTIPSWKNFPFLCTLTLLFAYAWIYILIPDVGFDSLAYHIPFIQSFVAHGSIPLPPTPNNWTEHVFYVFPKAVEMILGLWESLVPNALGWIQFIILIHAVLLLNYVAEQAGAKEKEWAGAFFLAAWPTLFYTKLYYVELTLFMLVVWLVAVFLSPSNKNVSMGAHEFLLALIAFGIVSSKISAFAYLAALGFVLYLLRPHVRSLLALVLGAIGGVLMSILPALMNGVSFLDELKIVQATSTGFHTTFAERALVMVYSLKSFWLTPSVLGATLGISALLFFFHPPTRKFTGLFWASLGVFLVVFLASDLYILTYLQVATYYGVAFLGLAFISIPIFLEFFFEKIPSHVFLLKSIANTILLFATIIIFLNMSFFIQGGAEKMYFYPDLFQVPDTPGTHVLMMGNINTPYGTYQHTNVSDYTTFPIMAGDPCLFWKEHGITHVVYWHPTSSTFQLDGGNPQFYRDAVQALQQNNCTQTINIPNEIQNGPIVARVI